MRNFYCKGEAFTKFNELYHREGAGPIFIRRKLVQGDDFFLFSVPDGHILVHEEPIYWE